MQLIKHYVCFSFMCETSSFQENEENIHAIKSIYQKINNSNIYLCKLPILLKWKWKGHAIVRRKSTCSLVKVFFSGPSMNTSMDKHILLWYIWYILSVVCFVRIDFSEQFHIECEARGVRWDVKTISSKTVKTYQR